MKVNHSFRTLSVQIAGEYLFREDENRYFKAEHPLIRVLNLLPERMKRLIFHHPADLTGLHFFQNGFFGNTLAGKVLNGMKNLAGSEAEPESRTGILLGI